MPRSQTPKAGLDLVVTRIKGSKPKRVLDVGAGDGLWAELLKDRDFTLDALEVWGNNVINHGLAKKYDAVWVTDMREYPHWNAYDVVIFGDVLEHIPQTDAIELIHRVYIAGCHVFLTIPISPCPQDGGAWGNPFETHHYDWTDEELRAIGFVQLHSGFNPNGRVEIGCYELLPRTKEASEIE